MIRVLPVIASMLVFAAPAIAAPAQGSPPVDASMEQLARQLEAQFRALGLEMTPEKEKALAELADRQARIMAPQMAQMMGQMMPQMMTAMAEAMRIIFTTPAPAASNTAK